MSKEKIMKPKILTIALLLVALACTSHAHEEQQAQIEALDEALVKAIQHLTETNEMRDNIANLHRLWIAVLDHHVFYFKAHTHRLQNQEAPCLSRETFDEVYSRSSMLAKGTRELLADMNLQGGDRNTISKSGFDIYRKLLNEGLSS